MPSPVQSGENFMNEKCGSSWNTVRHVSVTNVKMAGPRILGVQAMLKVKSGVLAHSQQSLAASL